jgi:hypothetical protein
MVGTTPTLTIGDAGAEDTKIVFDGNAQDYYVGLDDSADKLIIGVGSAVGTTAALSVDSSQNLEIEGTLNTLGFKGPRGNFTNSMLINDSATTGTLSSASNNTGFGNNVFEALTSGTGNTAVGAEALAVNTTGLNNVAIGFDALKANTIGFQNTVVGVFAMDDAVAASRNTAIGYATLTNLAASSATDTDNTGVGHGALQTLVTGQQQTAVGRDCLHLSTGSGNTGIGRQAGNSVSTGSNNVVIGVNCADTLTSGNNCIFIGNTARPSSGGAANQIAIGTVATCVGDNNFTFGNQTTDSNIAFGATSITAPSDIRLKEDIQEEKVGLDFINDLRPVTFIWKKEKDIPKEMIAYKEDSENRTMNGKYNHGFIAQEVKEAIDKHNLKEGFDMWQEDEADGRQRVAPSALISVMVKAVQELSSQVDELKSEINELKGN